MALITIEVSVDNRATLAKCYEQAKAYNMQFEGVVYARIVLEPIDEISIIFFRSLKHDDLHVKNAIERAHSLYNIAQTHVVNTDQLLM